MAEYTYINGDFTKLKTVLEKSGLFDSVEWGTFSVDGDGHSYTGVECKADGKSGFFKFGKSGSNPLYIGLNVNHGSTPTSSWWGFSSYAERIAHFPVSAYTTKNGVSIIGSLGRILITRNQNGKVVVAYGAAPDESNVDTDYYMGQISAIATTDGLPFTAFRANTAIGGQTLIIPICTLSSGLSYTDKAGILVHKQNTVMGTILFNGKQYFTDGYFVMEDEGDNA